VSLRPGQAARRGWPPFFMPDRGKVSGLRLSRDLPQPPAVAGGRHRGHKEKYAGNQSLRYEAVTDRRSSAHWPPRRDYAHNDRLSLWAGVPI
jgi:hypothetical protein